MARKNGSSVHIYRTYRFIDKDPIIDAVKTMVHDEHLKAGAVHEISGVSASTIHNWFDGDTRRPNNATVMAVASSLGYGRRDEITKDGRVVPGFAKLRDLDYQKEIEKQADFILKQNSGPKKKRRKRKLNGHAK